MQKLSEVLEMFTILTVVTVLGYKHICHQTVRFKYMQLIIGLLNMDKAGFLFFVFFKENPGTGDTGR